MTERNNENAPTSATAYPAVSVDPRDDAVAVEVAYRMQSAWPGAVMRGPVLTAAALARKRADRLLSEAMYLAQFGERPPGGEDATWAKWFREVEAYLREGTPER